VRLNLSGHGVVAASSSSKPGTSAAAAASVAVLFVYARSIRLTSGGAVFGERATTTTRY